MLQSQPRHHRCGIAVALGHAGFERLVERRERRLGWSQLGGLGVFLQPFQLAVADKRDDRRPAREEPSKTELRWCATFARGKLFESIDQLLVLLRVTALKARHAAAGIVLRQGVASRNGAGEKTPAKRRVSDETNTELVREWEDFWLDVARPQRIFGLQCDHRMDLVGAADGVHSPFRNSEVPNLA